MKKKNVLMIALSLCLVAIIAVGGTLAYFTDTTDSKVNTFTTGMVGIEIVDETPVVGGEDFVIGDKDPDTGDITYSEVMPGDVISKVVGVTLDEDSQDAWIAIKVDVTATPAEGSALSPANARAAVWSLIDKQVKTNDWEYQAIAGIDDVDTSRVYYFKNPVAPNFAVQPDPETQEDVKVAVPNILFEKLEIPTEWGNEFAEINFSIDVQAFAVQAANLDDFTAGQGQIDALIESTPALLG